MTSSLGARAPHASEAGSFTIAGQVTVHRLGYGGVSLAGPRGCGFGPCEDEDAAKAVLRRVRELGINLVDTADSYGPHTSESLIGKYLHPYPDGMLIASKVGMIRKSLEYSAGDVCGRPDYIRSSLEGSLKRLKLERIELYQLHRVDPQVPLEETAGAFADLIREGKIGMFGVSAVTVQQLETLAKVTPIATVQNNFNLADRSCEDVLEWCEARGVGFIPYWPLSKGRLTQVETVRQVALRHEASPSQIALAWLLDRSPVILPIPGTLSAAHLEENLGAGRIRLTDQDRADLEVIEQTPYVGFVKESAPS